MTYALYGQIERLSQTEQRGYNMMNLQSDRMFIDFEFLNKGELYRFTVSAKRQKKNFETVSAPDRQGYVFKDGEWRPLEDRKIRGGLSAESILGLSYEHFRRTVIIPQGKFQEFIQLTPANRTGMMETLFNLERFNLYGKSSSLLSAVRSDRAFQEGRREELEKFNREDLREKQEKLKKFQSEQEETGEKLKESSRKLREIEEILKFREEDKGLSVKLEEMEQRVPEILKIREELNRYREVHSRFHQLLLQRRSLHEEHRRREDELSRIKNRISEKERVIREGEEQWRALSAQWEKREELNGLLRSYTASGEIKKIDEENSRLSREQEALASVILRYREEEERGERSKEALLKEIHRKEEALPDWEEIRRIEEWFSRQDQLVREQESRQSRIKELENEEITLRHPLENLLEGEEDEAFTAALEKDMKDLEKERSLLREEQIRFETEKKLLTLSGDLDEGSPCPVCGSLHHPAPLGSENSDEKELSLKEKEESLRGRETALSELKRKWSIYVSGRDRIRAQLKKLSEELNQGEERRQTLLAEFIWPDFNAGKKEDFLNFSRESRLLQSSLQEDYNSLHKTDKALKSLAASSEESLRREQEIRVETGRFSASREAWQKQLRDDHRTALPENPEREQKLLQRQLEHLENSYPRMAEERKALELSRQELEKEGAAGQALLKELLLREKSLEDTIREERSSAGLESEEELEQILGLNLDIPSEQKRLDSFFQEKALLEDRRNTLSEKLKGRQYSPETHSDLKKQIYDLEKSRADALSAMGSLETQIRELTKGLEEKEKLLETLNKTLAREENLKELTSLFKGKKFTEYIAAIYLQELCIRANERFFPLSGRTLELVFENNTILVRDFLNEGKTRLVKTLSGGQTFQAALSLALALADQIGMGEDHFFFLDEGFGTLDRETLETVISTLRTISRDSRVIGLISHVDDLRHDLDVWLQINRSPEKGSLISSSWQLKE